MITFTKTYSIVLSAVLPVLAAGIAAGGDWPNWRGPRHDGISEETGWLASWPREGPRVLWRASIGTGFSSIAVSSGRAYTMGNIDDTDIVHCLDAESGRQIWRHEYASDLQPKNYEGGPNATPTVDGGRVYTISKFGRIFCLDAESGRVIWRVDLKKKYGIKPPTWGLAGSALVHGGKVVFNAGTWGIALDKKDGGLVWMSDTGPAGYATAVPYRMGGTDCLAMFSAEAVGGVEAETGELVWQYPWKTPYDENIADPIVSGDRVFVSSAMGVGCGLLKIDGKKASELWRNKNMRNHLNSSVLWKGFLYGIDEKQLQCLKFDTGEVVWTQKGTGKGSLMLAGGRLIILGERGTLAVAEASPKGYTELASAQVLTGKCWTVPVLANGRIYARNAAGDLVCLDVRGKASACKKSSGESQACGRAAADWPMFRGPKGDGKSPETGLLSSWPEGGPPLAWKIEGLGKGFSSVSMAGGRIFTMGDIGDDQFVIALDLDSRSRLWAVKVGPAWKTGKPGPRCTPTIDGELVYAIGTHGDMVCLKTKSGKEIWRKSFAGDFGGKMMTKWGYSESPLVDGDRVLCTPGGPDAVIVAMDKKTGEVLWKSSLPDIGERGLDGAGYGSIVAADICGIRQYLQIVGRGMIGVAAEDGRFLWGYNRIANNIANIPNAVVDGNHVFCTTSYKTGSALLELSAEGGGIKAREVYFLGPDEFENHHGGVILLNGYLYGGCGQNKGVPVCLEMKTGKIAWKADPPGKRSVAILYADGHLYMRYESGLMVLAEANPRAFKVKGSFEIPTTSGPSWPHPVIHGGILYLRDHDTLLGYDISL